MATTANYTIDPKGNMVSAGGNGMTPVPPSNPISAGNQSVGLAPTPQSTDPYTIFQGRLADMLTTAQKQSAENNRILGGTKDTLTSLSVSPNGTGTAFNPSIFSGNQVQNQETVQGAFEPAITSINTQEANTAAAMEGISSTIKSLQETAQPVVLAPGQSLVSRDGTVLKAGHSYTPTLNPITGLMDGFDQNSGTWASTDSTTGGGGTSAPQSNADLVGGIDFSGATTSTQPYATDPKKAEKVDAMYQQVQRTSSIPTADSLQQFITAHAGGKAPVTGQMIMTAAALYGVDPNVLAANIGEESDFGTAGAAKNTMNPGNVGNTGTATQSYKSWQDGVNASAYELARRMPGNKNANTANKGGNATSPVGGTFSESATAKINQLPQAYRNYVDSGPLGVAYINDDRVPDAVKQGLQTMASRAGIPYVSADDVNALKSIQTVLGNLDSMDKLAQEALNKGVTGHLWDQIVGGANEALQTEWGRKLGLFDNYRDTAIKAVQALAGGAGSGLRINMGEIQANSQNLPKSSDNLENAQANIKQFKQLIYTQLATTFPYAMAKVASPDGKTGSMPIGNLTQAIQAGYKVL